MVNSAKNNKVYNTSSLRLKMLKKFYYIFENVIAGRDLYSTNGSLTKGAHDRLNVFGKVKVSFSIMLCLSYH